MKTIKYIIILFFAGFLITSCEDRLEVLPEDDLASNTVFNSKATIEGIAIGMYSKLQDSDMNGVPQLMADFMSDNVNFVGSFPSLQDVRDFQALSTNTSIDNLWIDALETLAPANLLIADLPAVELPDLSSEEKTQFIAEAKFIRALVNFELVNLFAQPFQVSSGSSLGIPLVTTPFAGDIAAFQLERSSLNETHAAIEQDLLEAIAELPETNGARATKGAARALLSRLYLYRENWSQAATLADQVISDSQYSLAPDFTFYDSSSPENIFKVVNTAADPAVGTGYVNFYNSTEDNGRGDAPFTQDLVDAFGQFPMDKRFTELSKEAPDAGNTISRFTLKYPNALDASSDGPVLRTAEMYLNRAEANFRGGTTIGATPLADVNAVRARAGIPALTSVTLDDILTERRKELCFEGHRRMDLLRNNRNLRPDNNPRSAPGADKVILPIPDDEINLNPNITQNPGY